MLSKKQKKHFLVSTPDFDYYSVQGLEKLKNEMLRLLAIIDNVARDNNIKYWIDGGSLIGVIRHNGMIPWDDDLDISMLKDDYLLLIEKLSEYCEEHHDAYLFYKSPQSYHVCNYFASRMQKNPVLRGFVDPMYGLNKRNNRQKYIRKGIDFFSQYDTVYTTRLHGLILGIIMGLKIVIVDNKYNKCLNFYNTWLTEFDDISLLK